MDLLGAEHFFGHRRLDPRLIATRRRRLPSNSSAIRSAAAAWAAGSVLSAGGLIGSSGAPMIASISSW
jgi:hypothetical protein